ncbi:nitroreductase family deazaflavin-dependent oxidoreductase [Streptomyces eurythermus]
MPGRQAAPVGVHRQLPAPYPLLTSTGARSGLPRRTPLACVPEEGGGRLLIGSDFGRPDHPVWTRNLLAHPDATINRQGRDIPVTARLLTGAERTTAWQTALAFWPPYAAYQSRVEHEIRLFRLTRREPEAREP